MKILLDECLDWRLGRELPGHEVKAVRDMAWLGIGNGRLLELAQENFDAIITADHRMPNEQELSHYQISIIVLRASSNAKRDLIPLMPLVMARLEHCPPGKVTLIQSE